MANDYLHIKATAFYLEGNTDILVCTYILKIKKLLFKENLE